MLVPTKPTYLVAFAVILPFGGALFSQPLAFSRANDDRAAPERVVMMTATLRTTFSADRVVVVPVAGWIAGARSVFDVFTFAAIGHLGCAAVSAFLRLRPDTRVPPAPRPREAGPRRSVWKLIGRRKLVGLAGVLSIRTAIMLRLTLLPLAMINDYHGGYGDVGLTAALAAGLEVPLMLAWGYLAGRVSREKVIMHNDTIYAGCLAALASPARRETCCGCRSPTQWPRPRCSGWRSATSRPASKGRSDSRPRFST